MITLIIPVYNEKDVLGELYKRLNSIIHNMNIDFEILFINDGSTDESLEIIKNFQLLDKRISLIDLSRNYGKEIALAAGFDHALGDAVILIDADLQDPPELIPLLVKEWQTNGYDDVYAKRKQRKGESYLKKFTSFLFYRFLESLSSVPIQKDTGDYRLLSRKAVDAIKKMRENCRYTKGLYSLIGFKKKAVEFVREQRFAGKTKWNYFKLLNLAFDGITSFSISPLKISSFLGIIISIPSFIYMIYICIKTLILGIDSPGYASLMCVVLFLGGLQLLSIGIIGEYLGRIFYETKNRPLYFTNEYISEVSKNDNK